MIYRLLLQKCKKKKVSLTVLNVCWKNTLDVFGIFRVITLNLLLSLG